jgi:hypothetical protein
VVFVAGLLGELPRDGDLLFGCLCGDASFGVLLPVVGAYFCGEAARKVEFESRGCDFEGDVSLESSFCGEESRMMEVGRHFAGNGNSSGTFCLLIGF